MILNSINLEHSFFKLLHVVLSRFKGFVVQSTAIDTTGEPAHLSVKPELQKILLHCPTH